MATRVEVDTRALSRYANNLADGIESASRSCAQTAAERTARTIASGVPVLTGRLRASVRVVDVDQGAGVSYGETVPYAGKIERRDHTVATAVDAATDDYYRAQLQVAQTEARRS